MVSAFYLVMFVLPAAIIGLALLLAWKAPRYRTVSRSRATDSGSTTP